MTQMAIIIQKYIDVIVYNPNYKSYASTITAGTLKFKAFTFIHQTDKSCQ